MILIGARVFGLTFYGINGNVWVEDLMLALPGIRWMRRRKQIKAQADASAA